MPDTNMIFSWNRLILASSRVPKLLGADAGPV
jgi:hypothetical protein